MSLSVAATPVGAITPPRPNTPATDNYDAGKSNKALLTSLPKQAKFTNLLSEILNYSSQQTIRQNAVNSIRQNQQEDNSKADELGAIKARDTLSNRRPSVGVDLGPNIGVDLGPNIGSDIGPNPGSDLGPDIAKKAVIGAQPGEGENTEVEGGKSTTTANIYNKMEQQDGLLRAMQAIARSGLLTLMRSSAINFQNSAINATDSRFSIKGLEQAEENQNITNNLYLERNLRKSVATLDNVLAELPAVPLNASQ